MDDPTALVDRVTREEPPWSHPDRARASGRPGRPVPEPRSPDAGVPAQEGRSVRTRRSHGSRWPRALRLTAASAAMASKEW